MSEGGWSEGPLEQERWRWLSDQDSIRRGLISATALLETIIAPPVFWGIAYYYDSWWTQDCGRGGTAQRHRYPLRSEQSLQPVERPGRQHLPDAGLLRHGSEPGAAVPDG